MIDISWISILIVGYRTMILRHIRCKSKNHRRKFRSQTSDSMDRWKAEQSRGREKRKIRREKVRRERVRRKKMQMRENVGKSIWGPGGSKSRLAKAAGAEPAGQMRDEKLHAVVARSTFPSENIQNTSASDRFWKLRCWKSARRCGAKHISKSKCTKHTSVGPLLAVKMSKKCTPLWREAHFQVKMYKTHQVRTTFGSWDVEKVHAVVARSTFPSQNVQNTTCSRHFWRFGCWKSARRCGAKHISKSKCTKHHMFAPLLEVRMLKKCTPLWREAHFEVKMYKTYHVRTTFGGSDVVSRGRRKGLWTLSKVSKTWGFCSIFNYNHHYTTLHSNTLHYNYNYTFTTFYYTTLHYTTLNYTQLHHTTLHSTTLHYIALHYITLHYTTLHHTTLPSTTLHYTTLHSTTLYTRHYITLQLQLHNCTTTQLHSTTLHYSPLQSTTLNYTTLHYTTLHDTTLHYTTLHYLPLHFTTLHYTTLNYTTTTTTLHYTRLH